MKTSNILYFGIAAVSAYFVGKYVYNRIAKKEATKVISSSGSVIGTTVPTTPVVTTLTPQEKIELFETSRGYVGGANAPDFIIERSKIAANEALIKINALGLQAELAQYLASIANNPKAN